jgi:N-6 DNA Methylase
MSTLPTNLRRQLENAITQARKIAEGGARKALEALAVHEPDPYRHMDEAQRDLRRKLRAQAKQLADGESQTRRGAYEIKHLVEKLAYDQWHRLLFARFLLENNLLISPEHGVSVSLDDCEELAPSVGLKDAWAVAARFAAKELPEIFRADDPAGAVELPVEDRKPLIHLVTGLPVEVFTASESLGWCYQFWQAERKDEVNAAGNKIGADELPAVTQLFTEDYMVDFLLDNTLGAWHAGKVLAAKSALADAAQSEEELRSAVTLPGVAWKYLRFIQQDGKWTPAAGTFDGWPKTAKELQCLDPCMGSGHFVVAMFERVLALRTAEEKLDEAAAVAAVIRDNLFGLEIDPRCTQIGAFNLALAAWRRVGHCKLPAMNLACSGLGPNAKKEDWLKLAGDNDRLQRGMARLHALFKDAPVLGSLINPRLSAEDMFVADYHELQPLLEKALAQETKDDAAHEMAVTARGLAKAAEILAGQFTLVATNVPYLGRGKQDEVLMDYCERVHPEAKADLATCFVERCLSFCSSGGSTVVVTPQNWLFLGTYKRLRQRLLTEAEWEVVIRLGEHSFESSQAAGAFVALVEITRHAPQKGVSFYGLDASSASLPKDKADVLLTAPGSIFGQEDQLEQPDCRIVFGDLNSRVPQLSTFAECYQGVRTGDRERFIVSFWEVADFKHYWTPFRNSSDCTDSYSGLYEAIRWEDGKGQLHEYAAETRDKLHDMHESGNRGWGRLGVAINQMRKLAAYHYLGERYDGNVNVIVPSKSVHLVPIWCFCSSPEYELAVRRLDQKLNVTNATLIKVPFDLAHWQKVAEEKYPHGLPKPFSSDPTQWLFNGHPKGSGQPLHVAVARLLGYQWPRQTGSSFPDCPALDQDGLEKLADKDGVVCLSATKGESPAAERLRTVLVQALGKFDLSALIASAGPKGSKSETLEEWLRDEFFEQHCALFQHRPFVWHVWDGHKSGFSALVNYHQLTHANLEKLTYAYLGDWIRRQQAAVDAGEAGSDARLQAAKQLQARLKLILEGDPPYDIFVRWKPLSKQAIGWRPDINDGVRMNIRPFATADILRKRVKIKWEKDRGKEPLRDKKDFPWFWGWNEEKQDFAGVGKEPDGNRWNDCHYTNEFKQGANKAR